MATTTYVTVNLVHLVWCSACHGTRWRVRVRVRVGVRVRVRVRVAVTPHLASCGQAGRALVLGQHQGNAMRELIEAGPVTPRGRGIRTRLLERWPSASVGS